MGGLAYLNSLGNRFVFDDLPSIVENRSIRNLSDLGAVLSPEREMATAGRPVVNLALAVNYAIGELDPTGYHVWNLAVHLLCALLLFGLVRRTLARQGDALRDAAPDLALAVALIWTLHPLNTEVVNYVTQRTESMMACFYLLTLYASLRALEPQGRGKWSALALVSCALGMASKESMVTAPLVVVLFDRVFVFPSFREAFAARAKLYVGLGATWLILAGLQSTGPRRRSAGFSTGVSPWTYLLNQVPLIARYFGLAVWPQSLVQNYGWPRPITLREVLPYGALLASLFAATLAAFRVQPRLAFLGAWVWITLSPTSSIVPIATEVGAERRMYLPLMALATLAVLGGAWLTRRAGRSVQAAVLVLVSLGLAAGTVARNREYASPLEMTRTTLARYPTPVAHYEVAMELLATGGPREEALAHLRAALPGAPRAHLALGLELFRDGQFDEAIAELEAFVREQPYLAQVVDAYEYIGKAHAQLERWTAAIEAFQAMLAIVPTYPVAHYLLAETYFETKDMRRAATHYQRYVETEWDDVGALNNLGIALGSLDRLAEATVTFRRAAELDPANGPVARNLAQALYLAGQTGEALYHARRAVALQPDDAGSQALVRILEALSR